MGFEEILSRKEALERVGEVRLRFEPSLLVGESPPRRGWGPELLGLTAFGCGVGACAELLLGAGTTSGFVLVCATGIATWSATALAKNARAPRRFILNFADETLRWEERPRPWRRARARVVPFDSVSDVRVIRAEAGRFALELELTGGLPEPSRGTPGGFRWPSRWPFRRARKASSTTRILVDRVPPSEVEALRKLWRMLRNALGLSRVDPV